MNIADYKYKTELHAHTKPMSRCSTVTPEELVDLYHSVGVDSLVITNHFLHDYFIDNPPRDEVIAAYMSDFNRAKVHAAKFGMNAVLGAEFAFPDNLDNHYLVYGLDENDMARAFGLLEQPYSEFYAAFKNDKNVIIQAHPHRPGGELQPLDTIDGIEPFNLVLNHYCQPTRSLSAVRGSDLIIIGGSDFHYDWQLATCLLRTKTPITDTYMLAELLKSKDYLLDICGAVVFPYGN